MTSVTVLDPVPAFVSAHGADQLNDASCVCAISEQGHDRPARL
ncbi:hypothetical protein ACPOL_2779 [Acidisarcina polymorpha]|uniref:Uncharacterized protein n=1 Tax=Acidisarcina polymorpha TaxID=2211140 RepID=A0A2Z5G027_9BACT|nr:hypothetical protein ACPOL_2779 [Acidisarcina polymorpha]